MAEGFDREGFLKDWFAERASDQPIYGWATELMVHLTEDEPGVAWDLIVDLVERAPDDDALGWVAAGPLEGLLCKHGPDFIDPVEVLARDDERFRKCLAGVGGLGEMEPDVYARMRRAAPGNHEPDAERA